MNIAIINDKNETQEKEFLKIFLTSSARKMLSGGSQRNFL